MKIIGWIRMGDKAACGGTVVEGLPNVISHGREISYEGAAIACRKHCHIGEAHKAHTLPNGRHQPHHGHRTIPGWCPLISTLNDIHGRANESGADVPLGFIYDSETEEWKGVDHTFDEFFILRDEEGNPVPNYGFRIETQDGEVFEGVTDAQGRTNVIATGEKETGLKIFLLRPDEVVNAK